MAKKSVKARQNKRVELEKKYRPKRVALKKLAQQSYAKGEIPWDVQIALQQLPRNSHPTRLHKRCQLCGRPRSVYRKFGMCRLCLRKYAMQGFIPGLVKASW
jgi:small subunit ribosomal protein S14